MCTRVVYSGTNGMVDFKPAQPFKFMGVKDLI